MSVNDIDIDVPPKRVGRTVAFAVVETSLSTSVEAAAGREDEKKPLLAEGGEKPPPASPRYGARRRSSTAKLALERVLRTRQRLWSTAVSAFVASIPALLVGYTIGFPSSALLDLTGDEGDLPKDYQFTTLLSDLFAVRITFITAQQLPVCHHSYCLICYPIIILCRLLLQLVPCLVGPWLAPLPTTGAGRCR